MPQQKCVVDQSSKLVAGPKACTQIYCNGLYPLRSRSPAPDNRDHKARARSSLDPWDHSANGMADAYLACQYQQEASGDFLLSIELASAN
jgi:hypothetical protein